MVSKRMLDRINSELRKKLTIQQWKNSSDVTSWFDTIPQKNKRVFSCFDICEFYPSISEDLLRRSLASARTLTDISDQEMDTILHARKSLLFSGGKNWVKNNRSSLFDVTMGSFDGAEICDLVGAYVLATLPKALHAKRKTSD